MRSSANRLVCIGVAVFTFVSLAACADDGSDFVRPASIPEVRMTPFSGGLGMSMTLHLLGARTHWSADRPTLDLGPDITVESLFVEDSGLATAHIVIDPAAQLGYRDVAIDFGDHQVVLDDGFIVETGGIAVTPNSAALGGTVSVQVNGYGTDFQQGYTYASIGTDADGIEVNWVEVERPNKAIVNITISSNARPGYLDVSMYNGPQAWTLYDGFRIDRGGISLMVEPREGHQGETVSDVTIRGRGTHFEQGQTMLYLDPRICEMGINCQVLVTELTVRDAENADAVIRISNAAELGLRDALVVTGDEAVRQDDAFEVLPTVPVCRTGAFVSASLDIGRRIDNQTGNVFESVPSGVVFYQPLDPPCGSGSPPIMVMPFDLDFIYPLSIFASTGPDDCPYPPTCDAGEYVYLENENAQLRYVRNFDPVSNRYGYRPDHQLTSEDYPFGEVLDLRTEGSLNEDMIPAFTAPDVFPCVPSDYEILAPQLWGGTTHDPATPLAIEWTLANTYPDAGLSMNLACTDVATGDGFVVITLPWDDGLYEWPVDTLAQLPEGNCYFGMSAGTEGPEFVMPFLDPSSGYVNQFKTSVGWQGYIGLRSP